MHTSRRKRRSSSLSLLRAMASNTTAPQLMSPCVMPTLCSLWEGGGRVDCSTNLLPLSVVVKREQQNGLCIVGLIGSLPDNLGNNGHIVVLGSRVNPPTHPVLLSPCPPAPSHGVCMRLDDCCSSSRIYKRLCHVIFFFAFVLNCSSEVFDGREGCTREREGPGPPCSPPLLHREFGASLTSDL